MLFKGRRVFLSLIAVDAHEGDDEASGSARLDVARAVVQVLPQQPVVLLVHADGLAQRHLHGTRGRPSHHMGLWQAGWHCVVGASEVYGHPHTGSPLELLRMPSK